jgi:hypothetical protein
MVTAIISDQYPMTLAGSRLQKKFPTCFLAHASDETPRLFVGSRLR